MAASSELATTFGTFHLVPSQLSFLSSESLSGSSINLELSLAAACSSLSLSAWILSRLGFVNFGRCSFTCLTSGSVLWMAPGCA